LCLPGFVPPCSKLVPGALGTRNPLKRIALQVLFPFLREFVYVSFVRGCFVPVYQRTSVPVQPLCTSLYQLYQLYQSVPVRISRSLVNLFVHQVGSQRMFKLSKSKDTSVSCSETIITRLSRGKTRQSVTIILVYEYPVDRQLFRIPGDSLQRPKIIRVIRS
jgi:hypothetical protein